MIPADDGDAIFDVPSGSALDEHGDHLPVFAHELAKSLAGIAARA